MPDIMDYWRCFHCSFQTSDAAEAAAHFGEDSGDDALCLFWSTIDDAERAHAYQQLIMELNSTRDELIELQSMSRRLAKMEDALHMALCIIENDAGPPASEETGRVRRKWVAELVDESGIDREAIAKRNHKEP